MGWDTEGRRKLLLSAATRHFAERGLAGARIDAIARDAGVNKERIYQYFGDKDALRAEVQRQAMQDSIGAAEISGAGPGALAGYAAQLFDIFTERPELARLLAWEALEGSEPIAREVRVLAWNDKVADLRAALPGLDEQRARHLLLSVFTLVTGRWSLPHLHEVLLPGETDDSVRREALLRQVTWMAAAAADSA